MLLSRDKEMQKMGRVIVRGAIPTDACDMEKVLLYFNCGKRQDDIMGKQIFFRHRREITTLNKLFKICKEYGYNGHCKGALMEIELVYKKVKKLAEMYETYSPVREFLKEQEKLMLKGLK